MNIFCAHCGQRYTVPEKLGGKQVKCKKCAALIAIPKIADKTEPAPLDDPLRSFFDQELPPADSAPEAAGIPLVTRKTPRTSRSVNFNALKTAISLLLGFMSAIRRKPLLSSWAVLLVALLVSLALWFAGFWRLGMIWGKACCFLGIAMGIMVIIWIWRGPRPRFSWGQCIAGGLFGVCSVVVPQIVMADMSRQARGAVQVFMGVLMLLFSLLILSGIPREIRRRMWKGVFMFIAAVLMNTMGGLTQIAMLIPAAQEMHMARRGHRPATSRQPSRAVARHDPAPTRSHNPRRPAAVSQSYPPRQSPPRIEDHQPRQSPHGNVNRSPRRVDRPTPETRKPAAAKRQVSEAELRRFMPTPAAEVTDVWKVQPDPFAEDIHVSPELLIRIPSNMGNDAVIVLPVSPSRFMAICNRRDRDKPVSVWDCGSAKQVGQFNRPRGCFTANFAISPDGRLGAEIFSQRQHRFAGVWSIKTGQQISEMPLPQNSGINFMQFSGSNRLVASSELGDREDQKHEIRVWNIADSRLEQQFVVEADHIFVKEFAISPTGKYLATAGKHLEIHDLRSGELVGARPFPGIADTKEWQVRGISFSPNDAELVAFFTMVNSLGRPSMKTVNWDLNDGSVIANHTKPGRWYLTSFRSHRSTKIDWMEGNRGWFVGECVAIDRKTGNLLWNFKTDSETSMRLIGGRYMLGFTACGLSRSLVALDFSPTKKPDFDNHPLIFKPSFMESYPFKRVLRMQVLDYGGSGDLVAAAKKALTGVPRVDPNAIEFDQQNGELVIGMSKRRLCSFPAVRKALQEAGFKIGNLGFRLR